MSVVELRLERCFEVAHCADRCAVLSREAFESVHECEFTQTHWNRRPRLSRAPTVARSREHVLALPCGVQQSTGSANVWHSIQNSAHTPLSRGSCLACRALCAIAHLSATEKYMFMTGCIASGEVHSGLLAVGRFHEVSVTQTRCRLPHSDYRTLSAVPNIRDIKRKEN